MKEMYLVYHPIESSYLFGEGVDRYELRNTQSWAGVSIDKLIQNLRSSINLNRPAILHAVEIPEDFKPRVRGLFKTTRVDVKFEKK